MDVFKARVSYGSLIQQLGLSDQKIQAMMKQAYADRVIREVVEVEVRPSAIRGFGAFAVDAIPEGTHFPAQVYNILDRYLNHSHEPTVRLERNSYSILQWVTSIQIPAGLEMTADYMQVLRVLRPENTPIFPYA